MHYAGPLVLVHIGFPTPFKQSESAAVDPAVGSAAGDDDAAMETVQGKVEYMVQRGLADAVVAALAPGGRLLLQSNKKHVAVQLTTHFLGYASMALPGNESSTAPQWLSTNPVGVATETEAACLVTGRPVFRLLLCKGSSSCKG